MMKRFENYYTARFAGDLRRYYDISPEFAGKRFPFIGFMTEPIGCNKRESLKWGFADVDAAEHKHMFASAVFYTTLFPQVIGRVYGVPAMEDFLTASGWPWMNCGLGGLMSPIQVIYESRLRPADEDREAFKTRFNTATDYLVKDFLEFFSSGVPSLDVKAHEALVQLVDVQKMASEIDALKENFLRWIDDPAEPYESMYVPLENYPAGW